MQLITLLVPLFASLAFFEAVSAQSANAYNVTVLMGDSSKIDTHDGKLKMQLKSDTMKYDIALSPKTETFKKGDKHFYLVAAPYTIDRVVLIWTPKKKLIDPSSWFKSKVYVNKVILDPVYIPNYGLRQASAKSFCAAKDNEGIKAKEEVVFRYKC